MRILSLGIVLFMFSGLGLCQDEPAPDAAEKAIQILMSRSSEGAYTSWDQKELGKLGDAGAVALTKVVGEKDLNPNEIRQALLTLMLSFDAPRMIAIEADRTPRTALFVLKHLDHLTSDPDLKNRISEERVRLEQMTKTKP